MAMTIETVGKITVVNLDTRLDADAAQVIKAEVLPLAVPGCRMLLDMTGVDYMSSVGLRVLLLMYRQIDTSTGTVILAGLSDRIRDVMSMTGFLDYFTTSETRDEGIEALKAY